MYGFVKLSTIFPAAIKGRAIAITTILNWGTNLIISSVFLDMMGKFC
jgi:SP family facilitated glucose transporter-like MFS transporter 12